MILMPVAPPSRLRSPAHVLDTQDAPDDIRPSAGPRSAEMLVVGLDDAFADIFAKREGTRQAGFVFDDAPTQTEPHRIIGRISFALAASAKTDILGPSHFETRIGRLSAEIREMPRLRLVLVLGVSAHLATLEACGIPFNRMDFRPGQITRLPDGLLIADADHLGAATLGQATGERRLNELDLLLPRIAEAMRASA